MQHVWLTGNSGMSVRACESGWWFVPESVFITCAAAAAARLLLEKKGVWERLLFDTSVFHFHPIPSETHRWLQTFRFFFFNMLRRFFFFKWLFKLQIHNDTEYRILFSPQSVATKH